MRVGNTIRPLAESFAHRVLERAGATLDGDNGRAKKFHAVNV